MRNKEDAKKDRGVGARPEKRTIMRRGSTKEEMRKKIREQRETVLGAIEQCKATIRPNAEKDKQRSKDNVPKQEL